MNFIQQVYKGKNEFWRYFMTLFVVFMGWQVIGMLPIIAASIAKTTGDNNFLFTLKNITLGIGINANLYLFLVILSFISGLISLLFAIKFIHKRKFKTLVTSRNTIDWARIFYSFFLWFTISVLLIYIDYYFNPANYVWNFQAKPFAILVIISFLFMPFQTSFEELLFRGYFMQSLGLWFKNAMVPLFVTSIIFGLLHIFNPEYDKLGPLVMIYYIGTGFLFGITTLMDEGTELSLGMHAANNIVAAIFVTVNWTVFKTDALFIDTSEPKVGLELFIPVFVIYPIILFIFSKKYGWKNWEQKLFGKIENPLNKKIDA